MSLFRCPICRLPLERTAGAYRCPGGHSFDVAKERYVHLLPPNQKHSALPGDDREMVLARRDFLSKSYYQLLLNTICNEISGLSGDAPVILDAGCGEGYYTAGVFQALTAAGKRPRMAGMDISMIPGDEENYKITTMVDLERFRERIVDGFSERKC